MSDVNLVWRQTLVALCFDPTSGELRDPLALLSTHDQLDRARRALTACLSQPLSLEVLELVRAALEPASPVPLAGDVVLCPSCKLPGHLRSIGGV